MGVPDEDLRRRLAELRRTDGGDTPDFSRVVLARERRETRRRVGGLAAGVVAALVVVVAVLPRLGNDRDGAPTTSPASSAATDTDSAVTDCPGPWSSAATCPPARWMRSVLPAAGFDVVDDTGSALVGASVDDSFFAWTTGRPLTAAELADEGYPEWRTFGDTVVYFGGLQYTWSVGPLQLWIESASVEDREQPKELPTWIISRLVQTSQAIPFPLPPSEKQDPDHCDFPALRPTYLPWLAAGKPVPSPTESYDEQINRAALWWRDPRVPYGEGGVGLTVYTHFPLSSEEETDIDIKGVAGQLHRLDESPDLVSLHWDLPTSSCNFLELVLVAPNLTKDEAVQELLKIARSLVV